MRVLGRSQDKFIVFQNIHKARITLHDRGGELDDSPEYSAERAGGSYPASYFMQKVQPWLFLFFAEDFGGASSRLFHQITHPGMGGFHIGTQADGPQMLGGGRPDRCDHHVFQPAPQSLFDPEFRSDLKKMRGLHGSGKEDHINLAASERPRRLSQWDRVLGQ